MKNKFWVVLMLICLSLILFSCGKGNGGKENGHTHTYSNEYSSNEEGHWYQATCEHTTEKKDFSSHIYYGDWIIIKPATEEEEGSEKKVCGVCGYELIKKIDKGSILHTYSDTYTSDETGHWYAATCGHTTERKDYASHTYGDWIIIKPATVEEVGIQKKICSACGYEHTEEIPVTNLEYTLNQDGTSYIVTGIGTITDTDIVIKNTYDSLPVTSIGKDAFSNCENIKSITIPNSIESIGNGAFSNCDSLSKVYYQGTIESWCNIAFSSSTSNPMEYASHFYLKNSNNKWDEVTSIEISNNITEIGDYQFIGFENVTSIIISNSVTSVGKDAFHDCSSFTNVYYEGTIESWCNIAFSSSTSNPMYHANHFHLKNSNNEWGEVTSIEIPNNITEIGDYQFIGFENVTSIIIPNSVTSVGKDAFHDCSSLAYNKYGNGYYLGNQDNLYIVLIKAISTEINNIEINKDTNFIYSSAFSDCSNLTSITIPNNVTSIGSGAFSNCFRLVEVYNLSSLNITKGDTSNGSAGYYAKVIHTSLEEKSNLIIKDDYVFVKDNENKYYLVKYNGTATDLVLPNDIEGGTYEINSGAFSDCSNLTSITISDSVTSIGGYAFSECRSLTSITIPDSVTSIGGYAFSECRSLTSITIPDSITSIEKRTFENCSSLTNIVIPNSVKSIGEGAFSGCNNIIQATLPSNAIISIPKTNIQKIVITGGESIEEDAFGICRSLKSITIPNSVTSIGANFLRCNNLDNVYYEGSIEDWCNITFKSVNSTPMLYAWHFHLKNSNNEWEEVTSIEIPSAITEIGAYQFFGFHYVTSITLPDGITSIGDGAFNGCSDLTSIVIPNSVTSIGIASFQECLILTNIVVPNSVTSIGDGAFSDCDSLTSITLPDGITSIGDGAFFDCFNLTSIVIPNGVTSIGKTAFMFCNNLTSITIPNGVTSIGESAFQYCYRLVEVYNLSSLNITKGSTSNGYLGYYARMIHNSSEESNLITNDDYVFIKDNENKYYLVKYNGTATDLVLPNDIEGNTYEINTGAFYKYRSLENITIPNSVTSIGKMAFMYCDSLTSIVIPNSVTSIGKMAFMYCDSLTSIVIPNSVTSIGESTFAGCSSLTSITLPFVGEKLNGTVNTNFDYIFEYISDIDDSLSEYVPETLKEVIITGGTSIGGYAFSDCSNLTSITIPDSVTSIGSYGFYKCSSLTSVYYEGTIENWCKIKFSDNTSNPMDYAEHFYLRNSNNEWEEVTSIEIPNTITEIGEDKFYGFNNVTSVTIPDSVTSIKVGAFHDCSSLTSITIPDSVTSIENYAFSGCSSLTSITIPNSVTSIGNYAFSGCSSLTNLYYEGTIEDWCNITLNGSILTSSKSNHFYIKNSNNEWEEVTSIEIPNTITEIGAYQFYGFNNVTSITIPDSVTSIKMGAFHDCSSLTNISIPDSVTSIGSYAFSGCSNLKKITIPNSIVEIGEVPFSDCSSLIYNEYDNGCYLGNKDNPYILLVKAKSTNITSCEINNTTKIIFYAAFRNCSSLTSIDIPEGVTSIGNYAFDGCSSLTSITIPDNVTSIGKKAFMYCDSLTSIVIPNSVTSIGESTFAGCSSLTSITIPDNVTSIGYDTFYNCSSLTSIVIPNSVTSIGYEAFSGCSNLKEVYYRGTSTEWSNITKGIWNSNLTSATRYYYSETKPTTSGNYWHYVDGVVTKW